MITAAAAAKAALDLVRFHYCRIDLADTLPGRAGHIPDPGFSAALLYDPQPQSSHIVASDIATHGPYAPSADALDLASSAEPRSRRSEGRL